MVSAITQQAGSLASSASSTGTSGKTSTGTDFDTFLKMLTAQLKNQDPLNPMEGNEFAVQLATFSGVEQQSQTNSLLTQLLAQSGSSGLGQVSEMIGKEVLTTAPVWFGSETLTLDITHEPGATGVTLIALDARGNEVTREEIGAGEGLVEWYGRDGTGQKLADGTYSFMTESTANGQIIGSSPVGVYSRVIEARADATGTSLILEGGAAAPLSEITAVRNPD
jgi:flagellar basal-body rod modification protein FlgD